MEMVRFRKCRYSYRILFGGFLQISMTTICTGEEFDTRALGD